MSRPAASLSVPAAWTRVGIVLVAVVVADQVLKHAITSSLQRSQEEHLVAGIKLVNVRNSGVAFGQLSDAGAIVSAVIALAVIALIAYFVRHSGRRGMWLPTGLLLGGALGNIVDRVRLGAVVDFIKLPYWPAFNVADTAITFGVIALLFIMERGDGARRSA